VCVVIIARISRGTFPAIAAIFLLVFDYTLQLATHLYPTAAMNEDLLNCGFSKCLKKFQKCLVPDTALSAVGKDLTDLLPCGVMKLL